MTRLIGLWGYASAGKDEAARALVEDGWRRDAIADRVRAGLLALNPLIYTASFEAGQYERLSDVVRDFGWDNAKRSFREVRELLQRFGTEAGRAIHGENVWIDALMRGWHAAGAPPTVITDVRFPNEAAAIEAAGGITVAITRPGVEPANGHASETALGLDSWLFDHLIDNTGTVADLHAEIRKVAARA